MQDINRATAEAVAAATAAGVTDAAVKVWEVA
jgi:hypothetical protein